MGKLDDISREALLAELESAETAKAAKRLMVALAYRDGVAVSTLADRYEIPESTLYYWLDRFAELPVSAAAADDDRPGRPKELDGDDREAVFRALADSPDAHGFDAAAWTPELVRTFIEREYGVSYSLGHVRRLIREADVDL